jgi:hypothetical protein
MAWGGIIIAAVWILAIIFAISAFVLARRADDEAQHLNARRAPSSDDVGETPAAAQKAGEGSRRRGDRLAQDGMDRTHVGKRL